MWRRSTHPNIVPLLCITLEPLQLISAWIPGEELMGYINGNPNVDRLALVGVSLLLHLDRIALTPFQVIQYR